MLNLCNTGVQEIKIIKKDHIQHTCWCPASPNPSLSQWDVRRSPPAARENSTIFSPCSAVRSAGASYGYRTNSSHPSVIHHVKGQIPTFSHPLYLLGLLWWILCFIPTSKPTQFSLYHCIRKLSALANHPSLLTESTLNKAARKTIEVITKQSRRSHDPGIFTLLATSTSLATSAVSS